ncbi:protease SohB [Porticoccus sp.]
MDYLLQYGLFLAKVATIVLSLVILVGVAFGVSNRVRKHAQGELEIEPLNESFEQMSDAMHLATLAPAGRKLWHKEKKKTEKDKKKQSVERQRLYLLDFKGDMRASAVASLRQEVTAVLSQAQAEDEVVVRLESAGGMVHSYGLAASQLDRIRQQGIPLTVCVDKVAASGGYMMACVADRILAAPFAMIGSIGVVAQLPNFNRLLKKHDVDVELHTAGEYKRTLTMFGENTDQGREKFIEDLEEIHDIFKQFVKNHRKQVDINEISTGKVWLGSHALEVSLVDEIKTSDEYLLSRSKEADIYLVKFVYHKSLSEKFGLAAENRADSLLLRWYDRLRSNSFLP